ncbi:MAG TPA: MTH1187 family thiamine-binding protein [Myxococcota bacterium]|nr:MTH1187 family thiamine-binding protein [Myxococcota bacterium]
MAIAAVSISPVGAGTSVGRFVAEALRVVHAQDRVRFELGAMFTTLEGDLDEILALVRRMQEAVFAAGAERVSTVLKIDDRRDRSARMQDKVRAVEERLAPPSSDRARGG